MKRSVLFASLMLAATAVVAADASPKDDVIKAAKKLASDNYSWHTTVKVPQGGNNRFRPGPTDGKFDKDTTMLTMTRGDNSTEAVLKTGGKGALKTQDNGWQSLSEAADDQGPGAFLARMLQNYRTPATEIEKLANATKELKKADDAWSSDLTEEGAKELLSFRPPGGGDGPSVSDAKGSVTFWLKDGAVAKYEFKLTGKISFNGNDRDIDRTTTVEIKDVGKTKVEVPDDAKKKLS